MRRDGEWSTTGSICPDMQYATTVEQQENASAMRQVGPGRLYWGDTCSPSDLTLILEATTSAQKMALIRLEPEDDASSIVHPSSMPLPLILGPEPVPGHEAIAMAASAVAPLIFSGQPHPRPRGATVLNEPGQWDFFISHTRRSGDAMLLASELKYELERRHYTAWLDVNEANKTTPAMVEGATHSRCCLAVLTGPCKNIDHPDEPEEGNALLNRS